MNRQRKPRRGAMLVLVAFTLIILLVTIVFTVDVAFMQLTRTELRTAVDAAARAAAESLSREQNEAAAIIAAQRIANSNRVANNNFSLPAEDIVFGRVSVTAAGATAFQAGVSPPNAVRIVTGRTSNRADGTVPLFFGRILGQPDFAPVQSAVAAQLDRDISLVLDHSGSMSGTKFTGLTTALNVFLNEIDNTPQIEHVSLIGYSSTASTLHQLTPTTSDIRTAFSTLRAGGTTAIGDGLNLGINSIFNDPLRRPFAEPLVVLMTDGIHNTGIDPEDVIDRAANANLVVHTITFGSGADETRMRLLAEETGGKHFHAPDNAALIAIFREIAASLPVVLTE